MKVLAGATLIDGTGGPVLPNAAVLIDGGRIADVGLGKTITYPAEADVIDLTGMTLLPGLIDCHDHLAQAGSELMGRWELDAPSSFRHLRTAKVLGDTLAMGYTSARDAGGLDAGFKQAIEEGLIAGPRLVLGITFISPTGGVDDKVSPSGHRRPWRSPNLPSGLADGVDAVRAKVREMVRVGADVIKFGATGGIGSQRGLKGIQFSREEVQALVEEAHALGRKVMCHAHGGPGLRMALEAGVDSVEHGAYLKEDPELIQIMAEKGIFYVPTFAVYIYHRQSPRADIRCRAKELLAHHVDSVQTALAAGVKVVAGTDAGAHVHANNAQELQCMVEEAGMTPMQALVAATGEAAQCLGMEGDVGTVEKGKLADLVAVDGDPTGDIKVLQDKSRIKLVLKGGQVVV